MFPVGAPKKRRLPTNDPDARRDAATDCNPMCTECGVSECGNSTHQPWVSRCGHYRALHLPEKSVSGAGESHPHPCRQCDCRGLVYLTLGDIMIEVQVIEISLRDPEA